MFKQLKARFSKAKKLAKKQPETLKYEELEQRVLFSADIVPGLDSIAVEEQVLVEDIAKDVQVERETAPVATEQMAAEQRWELVFVNQDVPDYEQLITDLQGGDNSRIIEVVVLESDQEGIGQVTETLAEHSDLVAVHFITHGANGQINLGNSWLDSTTLQHNSDAISSWGNALTETGDFLFYGCNIAADGDGQTLLDGIAQLTGADVAASDDLTGHRSLGGDWDLEYTDGRIETGVAFSISAQQSWKGQLAWFDANTGAPLAGPTNGADLFVGDAGNDININADNGDDALYGNDGDDDLVGGMHNDLLLGGAGMDTLTGQSGDDILLGGAGDDSLDGGSGVDILIGDGGNDILTGGNDDDLFLFSGAQHGDVYTVDGGNHNNTIDVSEFGAGNVTLVSGKITVDLGGGQSFEINHTNVQNIVLAEALVNHAAQADAGPDQAVGTSSLVTLDASGSSDPDSDSLTYDWQQIEGTWVTLSDPTSVSPTFTAPASADVLKFAVTVSDATTSDVDIVQITVGTGANVAPTITTVTGAPMVDEDAVYSLDLTFTDPDDSTVTWTVNWGDGQISSAPSTGATTTLTHTYTQPGFTYNILVSANDGDVTVLQNELLVPSYAAGDSIFRYEETTGAFLQEFATANGLDDPIQAIIGPDGNLYVTSEKSDHVLRYNAVTGAFIDEFVSAGSGGLNEPGGLAFGPDGNLYVSSFATDEVLRYDGTSGAFIDAFVTAGSGGLNEPYSLTFGSDGNLYVNSYWDSQVLRYNGTTGAFIDVFVSSGSGGLSTPEQMIFGPDGNLYIASCDTNEVLRYNGATGAFIDAFVTAGLGGLDQTTGLAFGPDGNLYVADHQDAVILRYNGTTGVFIDEYVSAGSGGLVKPVFISFLPEHQVTVTNVNDPGSVTIDNTSPVQGDTLTASVTDPDGATGAISYQWYRGGVAIGGATSSTYTTVQADVGAAITVTATYTDDLGAGESPTSTPTAAVTNVNQAPVVNDQTLSVDENAANGTLVGTVTATDSGPAVNYTMLYWADVQTDELRRINLDGTGNEQLAIQTDGTAATGMRSVAVDDVNGKVYWVNNNSDQIWRANLDGSSPEQILSGIVWPMGIAVDAAGEKIYWFDNNARELWWADLDGANAAALITAGINHPKTLAIDAGGGKLYWTDWGLSTIMRANLDGSNLETVVAGLDDPYGIALDTPAGKVYWAEPTLGEIQRADMVVGATAETVITGLSEPRAVTVDTINGKLYYADAGVDRIERANLDGSAIEIVTATGDWPTGLAIGPPVQNLTYAITGGNTNGAFTIDSVTGTITVANSSELDFETTLVFNLTVTVTDAGGLADSATITVNLNNLNETPVINNATFNVDENSANGTAVGTVPVTDPDAGDTHVYSITTGNTGGAFAIDNAGNITVANSGVLNFETTPVFTLTVQVQDQGGTGLTDTATITVNLNDLNETPVINNATFNVDENSANGTAVGTVPVTDPDAGDTHVYSITTGNTGGAFAIDNAGNITVANSGALNFETTPVFTLTLQAQDQGGTGLTDTATITINLNDLNETPVINNATFNVDENSANGTAVGTVPVTDPDAGDTHVYSITTGNTGGAFAIDNAGNITVANSGALNFETTPVFTLTVQVQDQGGTGLTDTATITINLNNLNETPVINNATFNVDENSANGTAVGTVPVTDPDAGDTHVYSITTGNTGGAFAIDNAGNITVANSGALNFETTPVFTLTVQVQDQGGTGLTDTATITINLNDLNETPVINNATFNVDENSANGTAVGTVPVTDPDAGDTHVYSITTGNTGGAFAIDNAGNITVANSGALNFETTPVFTLTVQAQDQGGTGMIDTATITINLNNLNETPVINNATFNVDENSTNGTAVGTVPVTDPDAGDTHVYSITTGNTGGAFAIDNAGNITVANSGALNFETTPVFTLTVQVQDQGGTGLTDTATITVNLNNLNETPVINNATFNVDENSTNGTAVGTVPVTDPDAGDTHVYSITTGNTGGAFAIDNAGNITVANSGALNFETTPVFTLTLQAQDQGGTGLTDTATITINLNDLNETPVINNATFNVDENSANGTAVGTVPVTDPDAGDTHVYSITTGNTGGAFAIDNAGNITVANSGALNFETTPVFTLTVQAQDQGGTGLIDTATVTVNLNDINDAPTITSVANTAATEDSPYSYTFTVSDVDVGDTLTLSAPTLPAWLSFDPATGILSGTPGNAEVGNHAVLLRVNDGTVNVDQSFTITVTNTNDAGSVTIDNTTPAQGDTLTASVTDPDGATGAISYQWFHDGVAISGENSDTYTTAQVDVGKVITVTADYTDDLLTVESLTGGPTLSVTNVNDVPVLGNNILTISEGATVTLDSSMLSATDVDHPDFSLTFNVTGVTAGHFAFSGDTATAITSFDQSDITAGTVVFVHDGSQTPPSYSVSVTDGTDSTAAISANIIFTNQNEAPTPDNNFLTITEDAADIPDNSTPSTTDAESPDISPTSDNPVFSGDAVTSITDFDQSDISDGTVVFVHAGSENSPNHRVSITDFKRTDFGRNHDNMRTSNIQFSYQKFKLLLEANDLGELKTALGNLNITRLSSQDYDLVRNSLDAIKEEIGKEIMIGKTVLGSAIATSIGLSAGYVVWLLKGGSLLASVLSSLPAWQLADPLAILVGKTDDEDDDDESLKTIIDDGSRRDKDKESKASKSDNVKKESTKR